MPARDAAPLALVRDQLRERSGVASVERIRCSSELVDHTSRDHATGSLAFEVRSLAVCGFAAVGSEPTGKQVAAAIGRSVPTVRKRLESVSAMAGRSMKEIA